MYREIIHCVGSSCTWLVLLFETKLRSFQLESFPSDCYGATSFQQIPWMKMLKNFSFILEKSKGPFEVVFLLFFSLRSTYQCIFFISDFCNYRDIHCLAFIRFYDVLLIRKIIRTQLNALGLMESWSFEGQMKLIKCINKNCVDNYPNSLIFFFSKRISLCCRSTYSFFWGYESR